MSDQNTSFARAFARNYAQVLKKAGIGLASLVKLWILFSITAFTAFLPMIVTERYEITVFRWQHGTFSMDIGLAVVMVLWLVFLVTLTIAGNEAYSEMGGETA